MSNNYLKEKKIAIVIAFKDFRDEEYFIPRSVFVGHRAEVITYSTKIGQALGTYGGVTSVMHTIDEIDPNEFDAIVLVGGSGAKELMDNETIWDIVQKMNKDKKVIGAICVAPIILAKSGILDGRKATVWSSNTDKSAINILKEAGALYQTMPVSIDDNIITADGPQSSRHFADEITRKLTIL